MNAHSASAAENKILIPKNINFWPSIFICYNLPGAAAQDLNISICVMFSSSIALGQSGETLDSSHLKFVVKKQKNPLQKLFIIIYEEKGEKEEKMKKLLVASVMIFVLVMPVLNQEVEETAKTDIGEKVIGYVPVLPRIQSPDHNPYVKALCIGLANYYPDQAEYAILDFVSEWSSSQVWDVVFVVVNYSDSNASIKVEMEMMYNDGKSRFYKSRTTTMQSGNIMLFTLRVTDKIRTGVGDLFTVNGRISGAGMGNSNEVKTQVLIY